MAETSNAMFGQMSPEERAYWLEHMPAITQQESELERAQSLSDELRKGVQPPQHRMDWASQGARALSGIGSALEEQRMPGRYQAMREAIGGFARNYPKAGQPAASKYADGTVPVLRPEDDPYGNGGL